MRVGDLILRSIAKRCVSKDEAKGLASVCRDVASWFETPRKARLLTMRVGDLILRSIAKRCVSKDEATWASWFETRGGAALLTMRVQHSSRKKTSS
jgi:hypothetical protein